MDIVTSLSANHTIILLLSFIITSLHMFLNPYFPRKSPLSDLRSYCFFQGQAPMFLNSVTQKCADAHKIGMDIEIEIQVRGSRQARSCSSLCDVFSASVS